MSNPPLTPENHLPESFISNLSAIPAVTLTKPARWETSVAPASKTGSPKLAHRRRFVPLTVAGACAVAAAIVMTALLSDSPAGPAEAEALSVFARPAVDASGVRASTATLARNGASYQDARAVTTPNGTGYVMTADDGRVCLAIPDDPGAGFGQSCASTGDIERRGLHVALVSPRRGVMVAIVPRATSDAILHRSDGTSERLQIDDGIVAAAASGDASVSYRTATQLVTVSLHRSARCFQPPAGASPSKLRFMQRGMGVPPCTTTATLDVP